MQELKPSRRYLSKQYLIFSLIGGGILTAAFIFGGLISLDDPKAGFVFGTVFASLGGMFWVIAMLLSGSYYRSLKYEIRDDEVIVYVGIITKSVKHVPYRTVTNIKINRGLFDRFIFNIGTLNIQTAGMSGQTGAEESLVGMENVQEIYEIVAANLRKFRGAMGPTATENESPLSAPGAKLDDLLDELRAIRSAVEK